MGRPLRAAAGEVVYHVLNRVNGRMTLFADDSDYAAFERVLTQACTRVSMRLLAYCVMPNHWHLVVLPRQDGDLSRFMNWLTFTHTQRWHQHRHTVGEGHVYQGRFKSFPVETSEYLLTVCRYVECNPVRAGLVERAEQWSWSSASTRDAVCVHEWPMERPRDWRQWVNTDELPEQIAAVRRSVRKGQPYGSESWVERMVVQWNVGATVRGRGRPRQGFAHVRQTPIDRKPNRAPSAAPSWLGRPSKSRYFDFQCSSVVGIRRWQCCEKGCMSMSEAKEKSIAFNVRLKPVDHSNLPHSANYTSVGMAQGIAYVDFGFIEPALLGAIAKTATDGQSAPRAIDGQLVTRAAMGVDVLARLR